MEVARGGDLDDQYKKAVKEKSQIKEALIGGWACGIVNGLGYLHENGVAHRDIKLANLMLSNEGVIKLCDFGMAAEVGDGEWLEEYGKGTPLYQSPELCERRPYNEKVDTWAMGCVLYELATRQRPFDGKNMVAIAKKICQEKPKPIRSGYSPAMSAFVMSLLTKDIHDRPAMVDLVGDPFITAHIDKAPKPSRPVPAEVPSEPEPATSSRRGSDATRTTNRFLKNRPATIRAGSRGGEGEGTQKNGGQKKKKTVDILKRFTQLKAKVAKDELFSDSFSGSPLSRQQGTPAAWKDSGGIGEPLYSKGQQVLYTRSSEVVEILSAHLDDPEGGIYYTIQMPDGRDKQTLETSLQSMENQVAIYLGDSDDDDGWDSHFSPAGPAGFSGEEGATDNFFPMPMSPGGPAFGSEDYPEEWGNVVMEDDVQAGVMSPQRALA